APTPASTGGPGAARTRGPPLAVPSGRPAGAARPAPRARATLAHAEPDLRAAPELGVGRRILLDHDPLVPAEAEHFLDLPDDEAQRVERRDGLIPGHPEHERHRDERGPRAHDDADLGRERHLVSRRGLDLEDPAAR